MLWSAFCFALSAIAPILLYMALGYAVRCLYIKDDAFWKKLNGLVFRVFLSVLLFVNIYDVESFSAINGKGLLLILFVILLLILVGGVAAFFVRDRKQKGVVWQVVYRSNYAVVGIPLASSLGGVEAVTFASLVSAVSIPFYNTVSVFLLSYFSHEKEQKEKIGKVILSVFKNPLILGTLAGLAVLLVRSWIPADSAGIPVFSLKNDLTPVYSVLSAIAKASSPIALIVLGARFDFSAVRRSLGVLTAGTLLRIAVAPVIALSVGFAANALGIVSVGAAEYATLVAIGGTPVAVSSAVMVGEIGGDERLATSLVASTSLFSMFTLTLVITFLRAMGWI